jgi:hypothetical protein
LTTAAGPGGSISAGGFLAAGSNAAITASAAAGFTFTGFTGAVTSVTNPLLLLMDSPKSIAASFAGPPLLNASIVSRADGSATNERVWTVQVSNSGSGSALNARIASVQILAANPTANLGLISLGSTVFPAAVTTTSLAAGQSSTVPLRITFPVTAPATRIQIRINLAADNGYSNSVTLSNQVR